MTWLPSRLGRSIDILEPRAAEIDWAETAHALAHLNRFAGNAATPVSVGLHTIIATAATPDHLKPHMLLHDAHETRTGETPSPTKEALRVVAAELFGDTGPYIVDRVRDELERRHDMVFWEAAGLTRPDAAMRGAMKRADLVALATERRDFLIPGRRPWAVLDGASAFAADIRPLPRVYRWRPPDHVADELAALFRQWLPALDRRAAGSASQGAPP